MSKKKLYESTDEFDRGAKASGSFSLEHPIEDGTIDEDNLVAGMAHLADENPNWEDHIPQEAAIAYNQDEDYQKEYEEHVESCDFCQLLIETFDPPEIAMANILDEVRTAATMSSSGKLEQEKSSGVTAVIGTHLDPTLAEGSQLDPLPIAAIVNDEVIVAAIVDDEVIVAKTASPDFKPFKNVVIATDEYGDHEMVKVGTKLDLAKAYIDMGDRDSAKSILEVVVDEGEMADSLLNKLESD